MNTDFRLSIGFTRHYKTKKLKKALGYHGLWGLLCLWEYAAEHRPDGFLHGMSSDDIEIAIDWDCDTSLVDTLIKVGFLDGDDGTFSLHDWESHNPWAAHADDRSDKARLSRLSGICKVAAESFRKSGRVGITKNEYLEALHGRTVDEPLTNRLTPCSMLHAPAPCSLY